MATPDRIYVTLDGDGKATGFYHSQINIIPPEAIEITAAQHAQWVAGQGNVYWRGGMLVEVPAAPAEPIAQPAPTVESLQAALATLQKQSEQIAASLAALKPA